MSHFKSTIPPPKYPSKSQKEKLDSGVPVPPQPSYSWNKNKVFTISVLLGIIFLLLSLPGTYKATGKFFKLIDPSEFTRLFPATLSFIHAAVFAVIAFATIRVVNSM